MSGDKCNYANTALPITQTPPLPPPPSPSFLYARRKSTQFADPGFCPPREASFLAEEKTQESGRWCGHCHAFKPPRSG